MAGEIIITVIGNLTADPTVTFTQSGAAVANFSVASTPRVFDKASGEWQDGEPTFMRCNLWRQPAEHLADSLAKGARVIVAGRLRQRIYQTKEGENRTVMELEVDEIGASLKFATVQVTKATQANGASGSSGGGRTRKVAASSSVGFDDPPPF